MANSWTLAKDLSVPTMKNKLEPVPVTTVLFSYPFGVSCFPSPVVDVYNIRRISLQKRIFQKGHYQLLREEKGRSMEIPILREMVETKIALDKFKQGVPIRFAIPGVRSC